MADLQSPFSKDVQQLMSTISPETTLSIPAANAPEPLPMRWDPTALYHEGWHEFMHKRWGVRSAHVRYTVAEQGGASLETALYTDKRGSVVHRGYVPYVPLVFRASESRQGAKLARDWAQLADNLANDIRARGLKQKLFFQPGVTDIRAWQWNGFEASLKYTIALPFPFSLSQADYSVRKQVNKATRSAYRCERTSRLEDVLSCVEDTQARQRFSYCLTKADLELARSILGDDFFRVYVCYSPVGQPASARIVLFQPGVTTIDWVAGTASAHLTSGATQQLIAHVVNDVQTAGATSFDFCGANLPTVAASKMLWGGSLLPYYGVERTGAGNLLSRGVVLAKAFAREHSSPRVRALCNRLRSLVGRR